MDKVSLLSTEAYEFTRNVLKTLAVLDKQAMVKPGVRESTTYKGVLSMEKEAMRVGDVVKAFGQEPYEVDVTLTRKQKNVLVNQILKPVHKVLMEKVIPKYRTDEKYVEYGKRATVKAETLANLMRKLK